MENVAQVFVPEYIVIDKFSLAIMVHAGGGSTTTPNNQNHAAAGSSKYSGGAGTSSKAGAFSSGTGPAGDDNDPPKKPSQPPAPHPDDMIFPATNQTFRTIPRRLWRRAAALGWRDVPWHALTQTERGARRVESDMPWVASELAQLRSSVGQNILGPILSHLPRDEQQVAMHLLLDLVWHELYEAFGGEPAWVTVDMLHNFHSRQRFMLANFHTVIRAIDRNVDIAPLIHPVRDSLPPALSDLALPPTNVMPPPNRRMFIRLDIQGQPHIAASGVIYTGFWRFCLEDTDVAPDEETDE
jgi:hypothetical protein